MASSDKDRISALVVLRTASGDVCPSDAVITAVTLRRYAPTPAMAREASAAFEASGFEVGPMIGNSFSITAGRQTFETVFGVKIAASKRRGLVCVRPDGSKTEEFPIGRAPAALTKHVGAVTFTPPPDFGPTEFGP